MANASGIPTASPTLAPVLRDDEEFGVAIAVEDDVAVAMVVVAVIVVADFDVVAPPGDVVEVVELELVVWVDCVVILNEGDVKGMPKFVPL